jgi:hypothetical protein
MIEQSGQSFKEQKRRETIKKMIKSNNLRIREVLILILIFIITIYTVYSAPIGPTISYNSSETRDPDSAALVNTSGGSITTMILNATVQNVRWKAYVGNVTGTLTLDDTNNNTVFSWDMTSLTGEVYATRTSDSITWTNINCSNSTHINNEELALNHTNPDDNISTTFSGKSHDQFYVGSVLIGQNNCSSVNTYVNDSNQSTFFEEVLLYDGANMVYTSILEQDKPGFDNSTYDFQMIVPENGLSTWSSSIAYYFYVELT